MNSLLAINIVRGPVIVGAIALSMALVIYLLARRPTRRWLITSVVALLTGVVLAVLTWFILVRINNTFGIPIDRAVYILLAATLACMCLAIVNLWSSRWWRKVIAGFAVVVFLITGILGINAVFGLNYTLGTLIGIPSENAIVLPSVIPAPTENPNSGPLWQTWIPPSNLPTVGRIGTQVIPNTNSGFTARPAVIYLPPAALVPGAPPLPLVIMMMGQPGTPDGLYSSQILDKFAARHNGLAPIVIVADQIGNMYQDPLCLDTQQFGKAKTYITEDVVNWAKTNLNIIHDHAYWTIAGFSNGGTCAISFIAGYPQIWSNVFDISGEEYPGAERPGEVLAKIFHGNEAAYEGIKPLKMLADHSLPGTFGVFTVGSDDHRYILAAKRMVAAATAAGMEAFYYESPNGGHMLPALPDGLTRSYELLYPRLGLSAGAP